MSDYIVSARKYRPDSFEGLIGQENIARTLKNSILRGKIAHAYLFCGPRGVGKTSTARIFAKAINCSNPTEDMEPCGQCESCVSFAEGRSYCIHELDAASNNGVDDMKALLEQVQVPPQVGRYSVYIIDEVHMLTTSAFNAFLKTLEEPPAHAIFILATTEKHKVLPTILSRCQTYDFNRISIPDIVRNLRDIATKENITIDDESLHIIARKADGAMRDALTIFDQTVAFCGTEVKYEDVLRNLNVLDYEYCFSLVDAFLRGDYASALMTFDEVLVKGFNALHFISALSSHLRDLIVARTSGLEPLLELPQSLKVRYGEQAARCPLDFLYNALSVTVPCEAGFKASSNPRLHIEFALMKLAFLLNPPAKTARVAQVVSVTAPPAPAHAAKETSAPVENAPKLQAVPETPVSPAPELKETPARVEKEAAPRRRGVAGLSVSGIMEAESRKAEVHAEIQEAGEAPSDEAILEGWKQFCGIYTDKPRLKVALVNAAFSLAAGDAPGRRVLSFEVTNEAQRDWIEGQILSDMEAKFQNALGSKAVKLSVKAAEVVVTEEKYMPEEKAKDLMEKNEEVRNLVLDLGLEIK